MPDALFNRARGRSALALALAAVLAALFAAPASATWSQPPLGAPQTAGYSVSNLDEAKDEFSDGTGLAFGPVITTRKTVVLSDGSVRRMTFKQTRTVRGGPFVELVQASSAVGPWATSGGDASFFLSYRVPDVWAAGVRLAVAGMTPVAVAGSDFVIWRSPQGALIRLVDSDSDVAWNDTPAGDPPGALDFGQPIALTFSPCDGPKLKTLFTEALGVTWRPHASFPLPYEFADGTSGTINGEVDATLTGPPFLSVETPLHAPAGAPYVCTATRTPVHVIFLTENVAGFAAQASGAGFDWISRVPGLTSYHRGTRSGIFLEIAHISFLGG